MRVGIIALQHESNTFLPTPTTIESFAQGAILTGTAIRKEFGKAFHEVGGFFEGLAAEKITAVPIFLAWAMPGGKITGPTVKELIGRMTAELDLAGRLDGLLVAPHGAAVSQLHPDMDGYWLSLLRKRFGKNFPIIATLDPHANLSAKMAACDALIAYRTNPHLDQRDRGVEAARLMARRLRGECRPVTAAAFPPVAINIERQLTAQPPCKGLFELAERVRQQPGVLTCSIILGFPYADVNEMGSSVVVTTDGNQEQAQKFADSIAGYLVEHRAKFVGKLISIDQAIRKAARAEPPVCLLDMGDNVGGGSPGGGTLLLEALIKKKLGPAFCCLFDPESVGQANAGGVSRRLRMKLGGKTDNRHGPTLGLDVVVRGLYSGKFSEHQVRHGGKTHYDMGPSAVVETADGLQTILLTSRRMAPFSLSQLTSCKIDPTKFRILVAKGVHAPVAAYAPVCRTLIRVNTPGVTTADMTALEFKHRRRPLYPFEE